MAVTFQILHDRYFSNLRWPLFFQQVDIFGSQVAEYLNSMPENCASVSHE
jgi:hypothetical protein